VILGDTHIWNFEDLPRDIFKEIEDSDWAIHVGDYVSIDVLDGLRKLKGDRFKGVYGNADPKYVIDIVPSREIFEISGKKIGITHPASGGSHENIETKVIDEEFTSYENFDMVIKWYGEERTWLPVQITVVSPNRCIDWIHFHLDYIEDGNYDRTIDRTFYGNWD